MKFSLLSKDNIVPHPYGKYPVALLIRAVKTALWCRMLTVRCRLIGQHGLEKLC